MASNPPIKTTIHSEKGEASKASESLASRKATIDKFHKEQQDLEEKMRRASDPKVFDTLKKRWNEIQDFLESKGPEPRESEVGKGFKERLRKAVPGTKESSDETKKLQNDVLKAQLKALKQSTKKPVSIPTVHGRFSLPKFTIQNATGIVIVELVIIFILEVGAGSKFVKLWNYAFSPDANLAGDIPESVNTIADIVTNTQADTPQIHGSVNGKFTPQSVNSGAGLLESWGVSTEYQYSGGYNW